MIRRRDPDDRHRLRSVHRHEHVLDLGRVQAVVLRLDHQPVGLDGAVSVTVSPDGKQVYVASQYDSALAVFNRNATTGALIFVEVQRNGLGGVDGLDVATSVTVSPDGKHVYAAGQNDDAVAVFSVSIVDNADLAVAKLVNNSSPQEGNTVTFTVTVTNNGPDAATGVVVSDAIPSGLALQSTTISDGAYSSGAGNWTLASPLASGAGATLTLETIVDEGTVGSTITNTAAVAASDQFDPDAGNDTDSAAVTVAVAVAVAPPLPITSLGIWGLAIIVTAFAVIVTWRSRGRTTGA